MEFFANSITAKSRHHERNEDSFICNDHYIVIADGMGGEACGDVASNIAIKVISSFLDRDLSMESSEEDIRILAFTAISSADREILKYMETHPESEGMGTTILLLVHIDQNVYVAWCGDSHCYYCDSSRKLHSLTKDHSYVQQLIDEKLISREESFTHPDNNIITRYVGGGEDSCIPEFTSSRLDDDGIIILCSDGLSGYCRLEEIEQELQSPRHDNLPKRLLNLAISKGSDDDITIVTLTTNANPQKARKSVFGWLKQLMPLHLKMP